MFTATYSPEDNKLRLSSLHRLDAELYARVRAAGFIWAPKQEIFVAPMWTPHREDLLIELCGEIDDEDTSLVERAEERAERFEEYKENRIADAESARDAVESIAGGIPFGQPILVGHHSERRARKDAEKIERGMARTVRMWENARYWEQRAAGAIRHAKYKERPDVRARRIKTLEAALRKDEKVRGNAQQALALWTKDGLTLARATAIANHCYNGLYISRCFPVADYPRVEGASTYEGQMSLWSALDGKVIDENQARDIAVRSLRGTIASRDRWIDHYTNRIAYERAMLAESGGLVAENHDIVVGGQVLVRGEWCTVLKINKREGVVSSFQTSRRYVSKVTPEMVKDYRAPSAEQAAAVQAAMEPAPICNYPGERFATMTQAEWDDVHRDYKGPTEIAATETEARHRVRTCLGTRCHLPAPTGEELEPGYVSANRTHKYWPVYITDAKRKDPPAAATTTPAVLDIPANQREMPTTAGHASTSDARIPDANELHAMKKANVVQVVSAPQLFPTPKELARRMADLAGCMIGHRVLEPSAGTGNLLRAIFSSTTGANCVKVVAVEQNHSLVEVLEEQRQKTLYANDSNFEIHAGDFLEQNGNLGTFHHILMNPPFANAVDVQHIKHAMHMLKPGGTLVAVCAGGSRQERELRPLAENSGGIWEPLPAGTFAESGTNVNTVLLTINAPAAS